MYSGRKFQCLHEGLGYILFSVSTFSLRYQKSLVNGDIIWKVLFSILNMYIEYIVKYNEHPFTLTKCVLENVFPCFNQKCMVNIK